MKFQLKRLLLLFIAVTVSFSACESSESNSTSDSKAFTTFSIMDPLSTGTINESLKTVSVTVPYGTDINSLAATFSLTGEKTTVEGVEQESNVSLNDFTNSVIYTVYAEDGSSTQYTVTVTIAEFTLVGKWLKVNSQYNRETITVTLGDKIDTDYDGSYESGAYDSYIKFEDSVYTQYRNITTALTDSGNINLYEGLTGCYYRDLSGVEYTYNNNTITINSKKGSYDYWKVEVLDSKHIKLTDLTQAVDVYTYYKIVTSSTEKSIIDNAIYNNEVWNFLIF